MADLFARLAARARGQTTALRPRPDCAYTGRSMIVGDQALQFNSAQAPLEITDIATATRPPRQFGAHAHLHSDDADQSQKPFVTKAIEPLVPPEREADRDDPHDAAPKPVRRDDPHDTAPKPVRRQLLRPPDSPTATPPAVTSTNDPPRDTRRPLDTVRPATTAGLSTIAQVVAALDAGSPVAPPRTADSRSTLAVTSVAETAPVNVDGTGREQIHGARRGNDVHVTIGELVVRGAPAPPTVAPTSPATAPAPSPTTPRLSLHDYLRGRREPR